MNREVEFHDIQDEIRHSLAKNYGCTNPVYSFGHRSCEMIAEDVKIYLPKEWQVVAVEVTEDDECGAILSFPVLPEFFNG